LSKLMQNSFNLINLINLICLRNCRCAFVPPIFAEDIVKEGHKVNHVQLELNLSGNLFILG
jgi:hypothetical protein